MNDQAHAPRIFFVGARLYPERKRRNAVPVLDANLALAYQSFSANLLTRHAQGIAANSSRAKIGV
jgi:hypothetical protein